MHHENQTLKTRAHIHEFTMNNHRKFIFYQRKDYIRNLIRVYQLRKKENLNHDIDTWKRGK